MASADLESSGRAAAAEGAGQSGAGGALRAAEEVRGQVQRVVSLSEEIRREGQGAGRNQDTAAGGTPRQQVKPAACCGCSCPLKQPKPVARKG